MNNPEIVQELKTIAEENGGILLPDRIIDRAAEPTSILHSWFEWNDQKAGHAFRMEQARRLIRISVEYLHNGNETVPFRVFVSLTSDRSVGGYRSMVSVLRDQDSKQQLLEDARTEMERFQTKYSMLEELSRVFEAMREAMAEKVA